MNKLIFNHKEKILYIIVGILTTVISFLSYFLFKITFNYLISTILSWICAVIFSFFTNKFFVFNSDSHKYDIKQQFISFITARLISLGIEVLGMICFVSFFKWNDILSKVIISIFVLITNYIFSKYYIFKDGE